MVTASVIVPAYNAEAFIGRALASVLVQTEPALEVLVIDDASTDGTAARVAQIARQDPRVRLLHLAVNSGPGAARNRGLEAARGEWVALLDADDAFTPQRIATLCALGAQTHADLVSDNLLLCPEHGGAAFPMIPNAVLGAPRPMSAAEFIAGNIGNPRTPRISYGFMHPIVRRSFLVRHRLRYEEQNRFGEDFLFYLACLAHGATWWITPAALYRYSVRAGSLTEAQSAADLNRIRAAERRLLDDPATAADPAFRRLLRRHLRGIDRRYAYRAFTDAVKDRAYRRALRLLFEDRSSFGHVARESTVQAPVILRKALCGGYRLRGHGHARPSE